MLQVKDKGFSANSLTRQPAPIKAGQIRRLLRRHKWRYRDLAEKLGVHLDTVQKWLDGDRKPSPEYSLRLQQLLEETKDGK